MNNRDKEIADTLPPLYAQDGRGDDAIVYLKLFRKDVKYVSHLIATAPELLACLDRLAQAAANLENTQGDPCHYLECRKEVRAATAEARELVHNLAVIANGKPVSK